MPSEVITVISVILLLTASVLAVYRCWYSESLSDRVMALDLMGAILMGGCVLLAILTGIELFLDVAVAIAIIAFLATIAFSRQVKSK